MPRTLGHRDAAPGRLEQTTGCGLVQNPAESHLFHSAGAEVWVPLRAQRLSADKATQQPLPPPTGRAGKRARTGAHSLDRCPRATCQASGASPQLLLPLIQGHLLTGLQPVELALELPALTRGDFLSSLVCPNLLHPTKGPPRQTQPLSLLPTLYFSGVPTLPAPWTPGSIVQAVALPSPLPGSLPSIVQSQSGHH